jgi:hypothetical protein
LATTASCAFSLVGITTSFGDETDHAKADIKRSAVLLSWASACFIVAVTFIVFPQLLYTELVMVQIMTQKDIEGWRKRLVRVSVGIFAWIPLGFQMAALYLLGQSLEIFAPGPVQLARHGITAGVAMVAVVTFIGVVSDEKGKRKLLTVVSCGYYQPVGNDRK